MIVTKLKRLPSLSHFLACWEDITPGVLRLHVGRRRSSALVSVLLSSRVFLSVRHVAAVARELLVHVANHFFLSLMFSLAICSFHNTFGVITRCEASEEGVFVLPFPAQETVNTTTDGEYLPTQLKRNCVSQERHMFVLSL